MAETHRTPGDKYGVGDNVRQKFTGYERDEETGLDFAEARYYYNNHGRFTAVDPLLASGKSADPQTFNRYAYTMNRPLILTDPTGLDPFCQANGRGCGGLPRGSGEEPRSDENEQTRRPNVGVSEITLETQSQSVTPGSRVAGTISIETSPAVGSDGSVVPSNTDILTGATVTIQLRRIAGSLPVGLVEGDAATPSETEVAPRQVIEMQQVIRETGVPVVFNFTVITPEEGVPDLGSSVTLRAEIVSVTRPSPSGAGTVLLTQFTPNQNNAQVTVNPQSATRQFTIRRAVPGPAPQPTPGQRR